MMRPLDWMLEEDGRTPRPATVAELAMARVDRMALVPGRIVGRDVVGALVLSTVFMGMDLNHDQHPAALPMLWETGVFNDAGDGELGDFVEVVARYTTWEAANAGHARAVRNFR